MQAIETLTHESVFTTAVRSILELSGKTVEGREIRGIPIIRSVVQKMNRNESLVFILPAFPAKSPSPLKTSGILPDLGEVLALKKLQEMCEEISGVYAPGARVIICSDGRVFSDVVSVPDTDITAYAEGIEEIIREFDLCHLSTFSMDELFPELSGNELRERVLLRFSQTLPEIREKARQNPALFNGLHRFMVEDQSGISTLSKNQLTKLMKEKTYELMRRSDAWSALIEEKFPECLRLSIHPYPLESEKFGVSLVKANSGWATPWHNVTVNTPSGIELMPKARALELGAVEKKLGGKYAYFEL